MENLAQYVGHLVMAYLAICRIDPGNTGFNHSGIILIEFSAYHSVSSMLLLGYVTYGKPSEFYGYELIATPPLSKNMPLVCEDFV